MHRAHAVIRRALQLKQRARCDAKCLLRKTGYFNGCFATIAAMCMLHKEAHNARLDFDRPKATADYLLLRVVLGACVHVSVYGFIHNAISIILAENIRAETK